MNKPQKNDSTQKLRLSLINPIEFINFLKKFSTQEPNILIELRGNEKITIKTATPQTRNIIKVGEINFDEIFISDNENIPENIFIGLYNISNFINTFDLFAEDKIDIILYYEMNQNGEYISKKTTIKTENLKYHFANAPMKLFEYMTDDIANNIFDISASCANFEMDKKLLSKIQRLVANEASKTFTIIAEKNKNIFINGKQFELKLTTTQSTNDDISVNIGRQYLNVLDKDTYDVYIVSKGLLFKSRDTITNIAIARDKDIQSIIDNPDLEIV